MVNVCIKTSKHYGSYLSRHLQKEHPKTKGKITVWCNECGQYPKMSGHKICYKCWSGKFYKSKKHPKIRHQKHGSSDPYSMKNLMGGVV